MTRSKFIFYLLLFLSLNYSFSQDLNSFQIGIQVGVNPEDFVGETGLLHTPGVGKIIAPPLSYGINMNWTRKNTFGFRIEFEYSLIGYKYFLDENETNLYKRSTERFHSMLVFTKYREPERIIFDRFSFGIGPKLIRRTHLYDDIISVPKGIFDIQSYGALIPIAIRFSFGKDWNITSYFSLGYELGIGGGPAIKLRSNFNL